MSSREGLARDIRRSLGEHNDNSKPVTQLVSALRVRVKELETALKKQAKAALSGMDAARAEGALRMEIAERLNAESLPELIESEREANAILTAEVERLEAENAELRERANEEITFLRQIAIAMRHGCKCQPEIFIRSRLERLQHQADDEGES